MARAGWRHSGDPGSFVNCNPVHRLMPRLALVAIAVCRRRRAEPRSIKISGLKLPGPIGFR
jgi:hypothetical protein